MTDAKVDTRTDAEFWNGLRLEEREELIKDALEGCKLPQSTLHALAGREWHCIPERLIIQGRYLKEALQPLVARPASTVKIGFDFDDGVVVP